MSLTRHERVIGTGITKKRETTIIPTDPMTAEDIEELQRQFGVPSPYASDTEYFIGELEALSQKILREAGLSLPVAHIHVLPDGSWHEIDADELRAPRVAGHRYMLGRTLVEERYPVDSPQGYAAQILWQINEVREMLSLQGIQHALRENIQHALRAALKIGTLYTEAHMKALWDLPAGVGTKSLQAASNGGQDRADKYRARDEQIHAMACEYWDGKTKKKVKGAIKYIRKNWSCNNLPPLPGDSRLGHIIAEAKAK